MNGVPQTVDSPHTQALAVRIVCMVLFGFVFSILSCILSVSAIAQLVVRVANSRPSPELSRFGSGLARYTAQVIEYLTFATETPPFPLSPFPD
jgi:hypothetical protein